jgi:hypothetical protein
VVWVDVVAMLGCASAAVVGLVLDCCECFGKPLSPFLISYFLFYDFYFMFSNII